MTYDEALNYINSLRRYSNKASFDCTKKLLEIMGNPQKQLRFVHVAGTNGKGSVCAMLASIFRKAGYRTGLFTTPHLITLNEIMRVDELSISDEELAEITGYVRSFAESMVDKPTRFGVAVAVGLEFFKRKNCEIVILETGLGGEFDSTNVIDTPELAVVTAISFDHTKQLGNTIESIAKAKAGIIKSGGEVVFCDSCDIASVVFAKKSKEVNANFHVVDLKKLNVIASDITGTFFHYGNYKDVFLPLLGNYQIFNCTLALTAADILKKKFELSDTAIKEGIASVKWQGRFEVLNKAPMFVFDGAHNLQGITSVVCNISRYFPDRKIIAIMGVMADKEIPLMVERLAPFVKSVHAITPEHPRALDSLDLASAFLSRTRIFTASYLKIENAVYAALKEARKDDVILATGTLHTYKAIVATVKKLKERGGEK